MPLNRKLFKQIGMSTFLKIWQSIARLLQVQAVRATGLALGFGGVLGISGVLGLAPVFAQPQAQPLPLGGVPVLVPSLEAGVQLPAYWFAPTAASAARSGTVTGAGVASPAVVALHGCDGLLNNEGRLGPQRLRYVRLLRDAGVGVLYTDSFTPRGEKSICSQKARVRKITEENRRLDVYGALNWLAAQPGVDATRLGVMGWSHGGQATLAAADRSLEVVASAAVKPAVLVAFYPGCAQFERSGRYAVVAPLLVMSGALDDWTPAAPCQRLTQRLQAQTVVAATASPGTTGAPAATTTATALEVQYIEFADSYHAFDSALPPSERRDVGGTPSGKATVGGNPAAREESAAAMLRFLSRHLRLGAQPTP